MLMGANLACYEPGAPAVGKSAARAVVAAGAGHGCAGSTSRHTLFTGFYETAFRKLTESAARGVKCAPPRPRHARGRRQPEHRPRRPNRRAGDPGNATRPNRTH